MERDTHCFGRVVPTSSYRVAACASLGIDLCGGRVAKNRLAPLARDSVGQKTLLANNPHVDQAAMYTGR